MYKLLANKSLHKLFKGMRIFVPTIPNKNIMETAAMIDKPAPESDASVKSLGIFLP